MDFFSIGWLLKVISLDLTKLDQKSWYSKRDKNKNDLVTELNWMILWELVGMKNLTFLISFQLTFGQSELEEGCDKHVQGLTL